MALGGAHRGTFTQRGFSVVQISPLLGLSILTPQIFSPSILHMENFFGLYLLGGLFYTLGACIASLCAGYETDAENAASTTRMAARMWLTIPIWPFGVVYGLLTGVCKLWVAAEWSRR